MQIYGYDDDFIFIPKNETRFIVYNSYSNRVIALNSRGYKLLLQIIDDGKKQNGKLSNVTSEIETFLNNLNAAGILFVDRKEHEDADFENVYSSRKQFFSHKAYLHLTQNCNLRCEYCYNKNNLGKYSNLPTNEWKRIIKKLYQENFDYIVFTGGEVMLRKDIVELAKYVHMLKMKLHVLTNGTIVVPDELFEYADAIEVSLDDTNDVRNDSVRKQSLIFNIYNNLKSYTDLQKRKIVIKTVVSVSNQHYIEEMRRNLFQIGISRINYMPCQPIAKGENTYPNKIFEREKHKFDAGMIAKCNGCYEVIAINADGKIYPCQALIKDGFQLADISCDNWLKKIEDSNITKIFYEDDILSNDCRNCAYKYICGGPCKAAAYNSEGIILGGREIYCDFTKKECNEYLKSVDFGEAKE